jgi:hypothetical protein
MMQSFSLRKTVDILGMSTIQLHLDSDSESTMNDNSQNFHYRFSKTALFRVSVYLIAQIGFSF